MCLIDEKEIERLRQTTCNKDLAKYINILMVALVDKGWQPELEDDDPWGYPRITFTRKETL